MTATVAAPLLENTQADFPPPAKKRGEGRAGRTRLRTIAGQMLPKERVAGCGRKLVGSRATLIARGERGAAWSGIETCGSIWLCAVCAAKVAELRRAEVEWIADQHVKAEAPRPSPCFVGPMPYRKPGAVYMATFTVPHTAFQSARELRDGVANAFRRFQSGAPWKRAKAHAGIVGTVRALEVTHGRKGWHPHLHVLLFADDLAAEIEEELSFWMFDRWAAMVARGGLGECSPDAFDFHKCHRAVDAAGYVGKWGCDSEIAKAGTKTARDANKSPWGLLLAANDGEPRARDLFEEYGMAMKGSRHLTWSKGLRELYGLGPEKTDEELAAAEEPFEGAKVLGTVEAPVWRKIVARGLTVECLEAAERGGWPEVLALLRMRGIHLSAVDDPPWEDLRQ
jgi:hypothetical protein